MQADKIPDEIMREARKLAKPFHAWDELEQRIARALLARDKRAAEKIEDLEDILHRIKQWCEAYPIGIFPEPDFKRAHELLTAGGITLDAISASNMRHVVTQIAKMIPVEKEDGR